MIQKKAKKDLEDKKFFWMLLRCIALEMVIAVSVFAGAGYALGGWLGYAPVVCAAVAGFLAVMFEVWSIYRRLKEYWCE